MAFKEWCFNVKTIYNSMNALANKHSAKIKWGNPFGNLDDFSAPVKIGVNKYDTLWDTPEQNYSGFPYSENEPAGKPILIDYYVFLPPLIRKDLIAQIGLYKCLNPEMRDTEFGILDPFSNYNRLDQAELSAPQKALLSKIVEFYEKLLDQFQKLQQIIQTNDNEIKALTTIEIAESLPKDLLYDFADYCIGFGTMADSVLLMKISHLFEQFGTTPLEPEYDRFIDQLEFSRISPQDTSPQVAWKEFLNTNYSENPFDYPLPINIGLYARFTDKNKPYHAIAVAEFLQEQLEAGVQGFEEHVDELYYCRNDLGNLYLKINNYERAMYFFQKILESYNQGLKEKDADYYQLAFDINDLYLKISKRPATDRENSLKQYLKEAKAQIEELQNQLREKVKKLEQVMSLAELKVFLQRISPEKQNEISQQTYLAHKTIWNTLTDEIREALIHADVFTNIGFQKHMVRETGLALELLLNKKVYPFLSDNRPENYATLGKIVNLIGSSDKSVGNVV